MKRLLNYAIRTIIVPGLFGKLKDQVWQRVEELRANPDYARLHRFEDIINSSCVYRSDLIEIIFVMNIQPTCPLRLNTIGMLRKGISNHARDIPN